MMLELPLWPGARWTWHANLSSTKNPWLQADRLGGRELQELLFKSLLFWSWPYTYLATCLVNMFGGGFLSDTFADMNGSGNPCLLFHNDVHVDARDFLLCF